MDNTRRFTRNSRRFSNRRRFRRSNNRYKGSTKPKFNIMQFVNKQTISSPKEEYQKDSFITGDNFLNLGLDQRFSAILQRIGFKTMTQVQKQTIPAILDNQSVLAIAATGTGKTGAFLVPTLNNLLFKTKQAKKVLVITPTRELAIQIYKEAKKILGKNHLNMVLTIGGESINRQIYKLEKQAQVVIATPGRLIDLMKRQKINIKDFGVVVIDEVDRLLDMGFIEDVDFILKQAPKDVQLLFFSATYNKKSMELVDKFLKGKEYKVIKLSNNTPVSHIEQKIVRYKGTQDKITKLLEILKQGDVKKAIVFVNTKVYADRIFKELRRNNIKVAVIHGDKSQNARKRAFNLLKDSKVQVLIATNVLARGIDIPDITHVINLDAPLNKDEYIHRIGRTGRFGRKGTAITFVEG